MPIIKTEASCCICGWKFSGLDRVAKIKKIMHETQTGHKIVVSENLKCICGNRIDLEHLYNKCSCGIVYDISGKSSGVYFDKQGMKDNLSAVFCENNYD
jgi:hypothetical protein